MTELCLLSRSTAQDKRETLFVALWLFIVFVSVHDAYLALWLEDSLSQYESNPLANVLLWLAGGRAWLLVLVKGLGTILSASLLLVLFDARKRIGLLAALAVASFQLGLLMYLSIDRHTLLELRLILTP
jgi:hypothetical protein